MTRRDAVAQLLDDFEGVLQLRERWQRHEIGPDVLPVERDAMLAALALQRAWLRERMLSLVEELVPLLDVELAAEARPGRPGKSSRMRPPAIAQADGHP